MDYCKMKRGRLWTIYKHYNQRTAKKNVRRTWRIQNRFNHEAFLRPKLHSASCALTVVQSCDSHLKYRWQLDVNTFKSPHAPTFADLCQPFSKWPSSNILSIASWGWNSTVFERLLRAFTRSFNDCAVSTKHPTPGRTSPDEYPAHMYS